MFKSHIPTILIYIFKDWFHSLRYLIHNTPSSQPNGPQLYKLTYLNCSNAQMHHHANVKNTWSRACKSTDFKTYRNTYLRCAHTHTLTHWQTCMHLVVISFNKLSGKIITAKTSMIICIKWDIYMPTFCRSTTHLEDGLPNLTV